MNEREFLDLLRYYFRKVKPEDVEEILSDYKAHFTEARERGLSDAQIAAELGHPEDIYASYQSEGIVSEKTKMEKISDNAEYLADKAQQKMHMKKHTKVALIVASCLSIGATFLMIHPSQAFFLDLPQQKNGIRQDTDKQMNQPGKDVQDIRIIKEETPDKQDKADEKKNPAPDNTLKEKSKEKQMPKKDSMKKTPENNKKDMPDTQSKVPPVEGNIPPAVQK